MLVHWLSGLTTVGLATACVHHGMDVVAVLSRLPFMSDASSVELVSGSASCLAGAACLNSLSLPFRLYLFSRHGRQGCDAVDRWRVAYIRGLRSAYKQHLRENPTASRRLS